MYLNVYLRGNWNVSWVTSWPEIQTQYPSVFADRIKKKEKKSFISHKNKNKNAKYRYSKKLTMYVFCLRWNRASRILSHTNNYPTYNKQFQNSNIFKTNFTRCIEPKTARNSATQTNKLNTNDPPIKKKTKTNLTLKFIKYFILNMK